MEIFGELPTKPVLFAACDSRYFFEHGPAFIYSANDVGSDIHIHIVDPIPEAYSIAAVLNSTTTVDISYTFSFSNPDLDEHQRRTYYACIRFLVLPLLLPHAKKILTLDIDCLIMRAVAFPTTECAYFPRQVADIEGVSGWIKEGSKVAAGAVYLTDAALNVADAIAKTINTLELKWYADQIALSAIFDQVPVQFVSHFDESFMDWGFVEGTVIWTGKGPRKYNNEKYLERKKSFDRIVKEVMPFQNIILKPRLDLPFKQMGLVRKSDAEIPELRIFWHLFAEGLENTLDNAHTIEMPRWMFNHTIQTFFPQDTVFFVPHVEKHNWQGNENTLYYMQTVFPWLFTIDTEGWGGGAGFVHDYNPEESFTCEAFDALKAYMIAGGTKFPQPRGKGLDIDEEFIFVPLQLPHDETIRWHADISCEQFVKSLCDWAEKKHNGPKVIFKGHPINLESMAPLKNIIDHYENSFYLTELDIHEVIPKASAVYVINSGVGQEAMLYDAKVVTFGRCEYMPVTIQGDIKVLDSTWQMVKEDDLEQRKYLYRSWYHWYVNKVCYSVPTPLNPFFDSAQVPYG